jgi:hypothetical protein
MNKYILILLLLLSGCTNLSNLKKPDNTVEFTISEDIIIFYTAGMNDTRHSRGILKGTYKAIAEDDDGYYFFAVDGKVIRLLGPLAEEFEKTKKYPEFRDTGFTGLWVPKANSKKTIDMFLVTRAGDLVDQYKPGGAGVITYATSRIMEGTVIFWHESNLPDMSNIPSLIRSK